MTALALTNPTPDPRPPAPAVDWSRWITAEQAARCLGIHAGTLKRRCKQMQKRGDAMHRAGPDDNKARWWISRSYDLRLAPGWAGEAHQAPDLSAYSERQVDLAMQRAACVKRLWQTRAGEARVQKLWLPKLIDELRGEHPDLRISRSTLFTWHAAYRDPADLVKLIDTRGGNTRGEPDPACWDIFRQLYLNENRRTRKSCWKRVRAKAKADGLTWCSYPQLLRLVRSKLSPAERCKHRNPDKYRSQHSDYQDMDPDTWAPGICWQGDHCVLDIWCSYQGKTIRPWLTAWMDWRTRKIVGWVLCDSPNSSTILAAFSRAMLDPSNQGGPDIVYIDNGKDYAAETFIGGTKAQVREAKRVLRGKDYDEPTFSGLYSVLSIKVIFALPYNSRAKGRIERWFGYSLHEEFDKYWPTYSGRSPETRPSGLAATLKDGGETPTFQEVHERLGEHIERYNRSCEHHKQDLDGLSPDEAMQLARRRVFGDPGVLDRFMLTYTKPVRVRRHRVTVPVLGAKGMAYKSDDPVFADLNGREEYYRVGYDQDDLREATLFDERMRPVCRLYQADFGRHATTAVGRKHLGRVLSRQRKLDGARKVQAAAGLDSVLNLEELALLEAEKESLPNPTPPVGGEQPAKLIQTPVDGQLNELRRQELRQAAGGEFDAAPGRRLADPSDFLSDLETPQFGVGDSGGNSGDDGDRPLNFSDYLEDDFDFGAPKTATDVHDYAPQDEGGVW